ncbi:hypothetical protein G6011_11376 [Alternaria panax]|uniref:Uncharacterized protein n=1 Tax=Alternaria panax TaxID=48097 RepID=A0AAD4IDA5_9PLEO|nr:hypothetical protein G6011_11376 [Alternaria panax]
MRHLVRTPKYSSLYMLMPTPQPALSTSPATPTTTSDQPAPPPINPLPLTSTPIPSSPRPAVQKPPLYHIPTDIITATEKGMISGSLCATIPSSSSAASSQKHDSEAKDVGGEALTRAEEAGGNSEGGRSVMFKGIDV